MSTPFDVLAGRYAELWSTTSEGRSQREQVWRELDAIFAGRDRILDIGCGTGDDAMHLRSLGIHVTGIDSSIEMVKIARDRGIDARHLAIEDLHSEPGRYDGALSNFGALNCVPDLPRVAKELHRLVRPGGSAALCMMSRFFWRESVRFALNAEFGRAVRRWRGHTCWRGLDIWYPTAGAIRQTFAPWFEPVRRVSIGSGDHVLHILRRRR